MTDKLLTAQNSLNLAEGIVFILSLLLLGHHGQFTDIEERLACYLSKVVLVHCITGSQIQKIDY
jgi:hypothetical protein